MAAKKKAPKKLRTKSKGTARKNATPKKKSAGKKTALKRGAAKTPAKKLAKAKAAVRTLSGAMAVSEAKKSVRRRRPAQHLVGSRPRDMAALSGQSGDLQGLSNTERADSESVDELLEEGNTLEAEAVAGVEEAGDNEGREVHTHEVPEDDVPEEYLEKE